MGSAALYHLARSGRQVLGIDRFQPPHEFGSSHGLSRIIREAYFEDPAYVPLVQRAYALWRQLETESGRQLLLPTGGLMIGPPEGPLVRGAQRSAQLHKLPHEVLTTKELRARFPAFKLDEGMVAIAEPRAGILFPETAVKTQLELAVQAGALLRFDEEVVSWQADRQGIEIRTSAAECYRAGWLVLSAGPWVTSLLPDLGLPLTVERQVLAWFEPIANVELFRPERFPIFICQYGPQQFFYGFPNLGEGLKIAIHHEGQSAVPDGARRAPSQDEIMRIRQLLGRFLPDADGQLNSATTCMYTNAPDEHFVFGPHPNYSRVIIVSPCSGHGFKFSPVIGELVECYVAGREPPFNLSLFKPSRFGGD